MNKPKDKKPAAQHLVQTKPAQFSTKFPKAKEEQGDPLPEKVNQKQLSMVPVETTPMQLVKMAIEQNVDVEKLERLVAMAEKATETQAKQAYVKAMAEFKNEPIEILKNKKVKYKTDKGITEYEHATLDNICSVIVPILSKHGLSHKWITDQSGDNIKVTCVVTHIMGHSESVTLVAPPDKTGGKNAIQAVGSSTKYLQRYTFLSILGLAVRDQYDDDGLGYSDQKSEGMPEEEKQDYIDRLNKSKTVAAAKNISKQATLACTKYKDTAAYDDIKAVYHKRCADIEDKKLGE